MNMNAKAAIRNSPCWLDALDLPADAPLPRVYPAPRTAIAARRRALDARQVAPVVAQGLDDIADRAPVPNPALREALRNAFLVMAGAIALVACAAHLL